MAGPEARSTAAAAAAVGVDASRQVLSERRWAKSTNTQRYFCGFAPVRLDLYIPREPNDS